MHMHMSTRILQGSTRVSTYTMKLPLTLTCTSQSEGIPRSKTRAGAIYMKKIVRASKTRLFSHSPRMQGPTPLGTCAHYYFEGGTHKTFLENVPA